MPPDSTTAVAPAADDTKPSRPSDPLPLEQLATEAVEELRSWETLRQVAFDKWAQVYDTLHETSIEVSKRGNRLNNALAAFLKNRIEIDRAYAQSLMKEPLEFHEPDVDRGIVRILLDIQKKMGLHMEAWCGIVEKDLSRITSEDGMVNHFHKNTDAKIKQEVSMKAEVYQMHHTTCEDWLAHQMLYSEKAYVPDGATTTKGLWETEATYRRQATLCQETQEMATKALEEALHTVNTLERWRVETTSKFVNGFGHKQHMSWTELQSITNNGIRILSQYNSVNNPRDRKKSSIEIAMSTTNGGDDKKTGRSPLQELRHFAGYERLTAGSRFERFSGKLLRPPRNILNPLAKWNETYVVITAYGYLHGWPIDDPKAREAAVSVNCNGALISKIKSDCFEIEEAAPQTWGVVFSTKKKVTLKSKTRDQRDHWIQALQHFQHTPLTMAEVEQSGGTHISSPSNRRNKGSGATAGTTAGASGAMVNHQSKSSSAVFLSEVESDKGEKKPPPPAGRPSADQRTSERSRTGPRYSDRDGVKDMESKPPPPPPPHPRGLAKSSFSVRSSEGLTVGGNHPSFPSRLSSSPKNGEKKKQQQQQQLRNHPSSSSMATTDAPPAPPLSPPPHDAVASLPPSPSLPPPPPDAASSLHVAASASSLDDMQAAPLVEKTVLRETLIDAPLKRISDLSSLSSSSSYRIRKESVGVGSVGVGSVESAGGLHKGRTSTTSKESRDKINSVRKDEKEGEKSPKKSEAGSQPSEGVVDPDSPHYVNHQHSVFQ